MEGIGCCFDVSGDVGAKIICVGVALRLALAGMGIPFSLACCGMYTTDRIDMNLKLSSIDFKV